MPTTTATLMTAEELMALPDDGNQYELTQGRLICMAPSALLPTIVGGKLFLKLGGFVDQHKLGVCGIADAGFRLESSPDTLRTPDLWFLSAERIRAGGALNTYWQGAPDLAVEVLSPTDRFVDVLEKAEDYLRTGTRLVWIIDPEGRSAAVFRPGARPILLAEDGVLDGADVLPGFAVVLRDVLA